MNIMATTDDSRNDQRDEHQSTREKEGEPSKKPMIVDVNSDDEKDG